MNIDQTGKVLALIQVVDRRVVDKATIAAWHDLIGDLDFEECLAAVKAHRRESTEYLLPAHIRQRVCDRRLARLKARPDPLPDVDPDDVAAFQARRLELRQAVVAPSGRKEITHG